MNKKSIVIIIILVLALASLPSVKPQSTQSNGATNKTAAFTRTILWNASTYDVSLMTNVNNVVYLSTLNGTVYAFNASSADVLWSFYAYAGVSSSDIQSVRPFTPSLSVSDGIVYIGSIVDVFALNASTGKMIWESPVGSFVQATPVVVAGVVFIGDTDNSVYAFNASNGIELWHSILGSSFYLIYSTPVVSDGVVYVGSGDSNVYAINATTGLQIWSRNIGVGGVFTSPKVVDGIVYGSAIYNGIYFALNATDGSQLDVDSSIIADILSGTLAVVGQSNVFIGAQLYYSEYLYSFNASDYSKLWNWSSNIGVIMSSPIVIDDVVLIVGSAVNGNVLYALNVTDGEQLWSYQLWIGNGGSRLSYFTYANGILYVKPDGGNLYAYNISSAFPSLDISILSPVSERYNDSSVPLVFLVGNGASWLAYSLDTHENVTVSGNSTISEVPNGLHNVTVYANDTFGHMVSKTVGFSVEAPAPFPVVPVVVAVLVILVSLTLLYIRLRHRKTA